jgi:4'-phosphopantetheinyl transferase EntD
VAEDLPRLPFEDWRGVAGPVIDASRALLPEEQSGVNRWAVKRQREFSTGRLYARRAMRELGIAAQPIRREDNRAPVWPSGVNGSLTHCNDIVAAVLCRSGVVRSVGLDVESRGRIHEELYRGLFTGNEQASLRAGVSATLLFAVKEAIYKALHPLAGTFIDFPQMEVGLVRGRLSACYLGEAGAVHALMPGLQLEARLLEHHAAALAWVP